jgi:hypothetical protein
MPETAEAAMRRACDLILQGDFFSAMSELTPEAMNDAMALGAGLTGIPLPQSYELSPPRQVGEDTRYDVVFRAGEREIRAFAGWRLIGDDWKITSIGIESMT